MCVDDDLYKPDKIGEKVKIFPLPQWQREVVLYWFPVAVAGLSAGLIFVILGQTPVIRAAALAATIMVVALTLRQFGGILALAGSLALAFSPAFWWQMGGSVPASTGTITLLLLIGGVVAGVFIWYRKEAGIGLILGFIVFTLLFWIVVGTPRSLRLTTFFTSGLICLLLNMLLLANPRPDEVHSGQLSPYHSWGLLVFLALSVLNDPLSTLIGPAVILGLILSKRRLPYWYWLLTIIILAVGLRGIAVQYLSSTWWSYPAAQAELNGIRVPYMMLDGWREGIRWLALFNLIGGQFTIVGVLLGVLGLGRLSRWYPPLGVVTMVAYAAYALFGLVYFGRDTAVLLLPLFTLQIIWITYAMFTLSQWLQKSVRSNSSVVRWAVPSLFALLPLIMLLRIAGVL